MATSARTFGFLFLILSLSIAATATSSLRRTSVWDSDTGEELGYEDIARRFTKRTAGGVHIPIVHTPRSGDDELDRRGNTAAIGLGDYVDVSYSVLLTLGQTTTPLILDTGSSDLWIMADSCTTGCGRNQPLYPVRRTPVTSGSGNTRTGFQRAGDLEARLFYGDTASGTAAFGEIGSDTVNLAGITMADQYFAAINRTNTSISRTGSAGIFGLGFPTNSVVWSTLFQRDLGIETRTGTMQRREEGTGFLSNLASRFNSLPFTSLPAFAPPKVSLPTKRQISSGMTALLASFNSYAPFLPRLVVEQGLAEPLFTVTLQRNTLDVGGNLGQLTLGELPLGVNASELTWVPVRNYSYAEKGLPAPPDSPSEKYPIAWEVMIDDVYLDGVKLPRSNLSSPSIALSALLDTGNSLIRGPEDVVQIIYERLSEGSAFEDLEIPIPPTPTPTPLSTAGASSSSSSSSSGSVAPGAPGSPTSTTATASGTSSTSSSQRMTSARFSCSEPHRLAFSIGGKLFPVDPRDFATQIMPDNVDVCGANVVGTDAPEVGGYLFSWSLGAPFLKSVLSAYHYGNLTYPSRDPPRMGFLSTVPDDADRLLQAAVASAARLQNFPMVTAPAPTGTGRLVSGGVVGSQSTGFPGIHSGARRARGLGSLAWAGVPVGVVGAWLVS